MRKVKFFASLTALMTLSVAALTACTTAEASTHHTVSQTGGESVHSSRLDAILERGYIEVATEPSFAPNEFIDTTKTGQDRYAGSDIQLANYIATLVNGGNHYATHLLKTVKSNDYSETVEAISALAYTPERAEAMNLSKGYYFGSEDPQKAYGLLIRQEDAGTITGAGDLKNRTITVQNGSLQELFVKEQLPDCGKLNLVSSANDAFLMVQTGRADAAAASLKMAQLYLDSTPESGLMILPDFYFTVDESTQGIRIGIPKGEDELTDRINEIIDMVLEQDLYNQWYEESREYAKSLGLDL